LALDARLEIDYDRYAEHIGWLAASGCDGITPNGSLGEYQTLTAEERTRIVSTAIEAAPDGFAVVPAVSAYESREAVRWAEQAAELDAPAVMALPPNSYRGDERSVFEHYRSLAAVGLPVVAYNNPIDTKIDLTPQLLARLHAEGLIVAVKEFAGDPRRAYQVRELAPELDVLIGSDDTLLEIALAGAQGWISGYTSAFPRSCVELYHSSVASDIGTALPLYRALHPLLRWDSRTEFVQAIKLSMDIVGRHGGPCRPPRVALTAEHEAEIRRLTQQAIDAGLN
jgi:4-hydroxy-tetrahydrodipicolinate synthase